MSDHRYPTPSPIRLELRIAAGNFDVSTTDAPVSTVSVEGPQSLVEATTVQLLGDRLVVSQQRRLFGFFDRLQGSLRVRATVPHRSRVQIMTATGDAALSGDFAEVDASTVSGDLRVGHVGRELSARTVSGSVEADTVDGSVTVKSVSGDLRVRSVRAGTVSFQSVSGDVEIGVAAGTDVDVDAGSASGALSSEIPLANEPGGGAGSKLIVRGKTVSGDFRLVRAA